MPRKHPQVARGTDVSSKVVVEPRNSPPSRPGPDRPESITEILERLYPETMRFLKEPLDVLGKD